MIRKTGFLLIIVLPVAAVLGLYVFRNLIVAGIAEGALAHLLNTEVDVEGVDLDPFAMEAQFSRLRIVDGDNPAQYLLVAGPGKFDLNGLQLFAGKVIVENLQVENLGVGIPRPANEIPPAPPAGNGAGPDSGQQGEDEGFGLELEIPKLNLDVLKGDVDVGLLTGNKELASLAAIDQAEKESAQRLDKLEGDYAKGNFETRYGQVSKQFASINFSSKNPKDLRNALNSLKQASTGAKTLGRDVSQFSKSAKAGYAAINASFKNIDRKIDEDIASIRSLANLGDINASQIGQMLFGQTVLDQFNWIMAKVKLAKDMLGSDDESATKAPELRAGRIITYPVTGRAFPGFLVENTGFTGFTPDESGNVDMLYSGTMTGLSSNARVYGKPLVIGAKASRKGASRWTITGNFDHRGPVGKDRITITGRRVDLGEFEMGGGELMPQKAVAENGTVNIRFGVSGEKINGQIKVVAKKLNFVFSEKSPKGGRLEKTMRDLFSGINNADLSATLGGTFSDPKFNVKTSIDRIFWQRTKDLFNQRTAAVNKQIREKVTASVRARRAKATAGINARKQRLQGKMDGVNRQVDAIKRVYTQKKREGKAKLKAVLKKAGGSKLKSKLKRLF